MPGSISAFDEPESPLTRATIPHIGYSLLLFSLLCAAAFCAAVSVALRATRSLPAWVWWTGFATAALLPLSIVFMPLFALPIWFTSASIALWRAGPAGPRAARR